jgi:hypothetical protein
MAYTFPVYEFRPLPTDRKLLRYNNGNWIEDDGEFDICFITDDPGVPFCYTVKLPYRKNILWSWAKDGNWGAHVNKHPNGNAWHYMSRDGGSDISDSWERHNHPNIKIHDVGSKIVCDKRGACNGRGPEFHIGDKYIQAGLVRERTSKTVVKFPKVFKCIYCGDHDLSKVKMEKQEA